MRRSGFALVLALGLMAFLVLLLVSLATIGRVETGVARARQNTAMARQHALFALELALSELQAAAGADQRVTATGALGGAAAGAEHWTGVWDFTHDGAPGVTWLVSGAEEPAQYTAHSPGRLIDQDRIWLVHAGSVDAEQDYVGAPLVEIRRPGPADQNELRGHYAWWVGDEGVKASIAALDQVAAIGDFAGLSLLQEQQLRQRANPAHRTEGWLHTAEVPFNQDDPAVREAVEDLVSPYQFGVAVPLEAAARRARYHDFTVLSEGLLTNSDPEKGGGLRYNLQLFGLPAEVRQRFQENGVEDVFATGAVLRAWNQFPNLDARGRLPLAPIAAEVYDALRPGDPYVAVIPILSESMLRMHVFHHPSRNQPVIRFYIEAEFWNPFAVPLLLKDSAELRAFYVSVSGLGELEVAATGGSVRRDIDTDMPTDAGLANTPSWMEFTGTSQDGTGYPVLAPGEVYQLADPDPVRQPQGLIKWSNSSLPVEDTHSVTVRLIPPDGGGRANFGIYAFEGAGVIGERLWELRNIPFEGASYAFLPRLSQGSKPYLPGEISVEDMHIFAFHYALNLADSWHAEDWGEWRREVDLRTPYISYDGSWLNGRSNRDFIRVLSTNPGEVEQMLGIFQGNQWIFDRASRDSALGSYGDIRLYDVPQGVPLTLADFRHLPFKDRPPYVLGSTRDDPDRPLNAAFDRYLLSAVPAGWAPGDPLGNPRLRVCPLPADVDGTVPDRLTDADLAAEDAARHLRLAGVFNWNSTSAPAWEAVLSQAFKEDQPWIYLDRQGLDPDGDRAGTRPIERAIFRHNFSAVTGGDPQPDDFFAPSGGEAVRDAAFRQGVRVVSEGKIRELADAIVQGLRARQEPLPSLRAFLDAGLLEDALDASGFNVGFLSHANGYVSQSDLVALLGLSAAVRSDTFVIRSYGDVWNPYIQRVEGRAALEALVQRTVPYVDASIDPAAIEPLRARRFEIIAFRWLDTHLDL